MAYSATIEHGSDGSCLGWIHELPGCFVRGASRDEVVARLPDAIRDFRGWLRGCGEDLDGGDAAGFEVEVVEEVESILATSEDTEALVLADRGRLTAGDWAKVERWLTCSRRRLLGALDALPQENLEHRPEGATRTLREELMHVAFVELMYVAWTFDLRTHGGLREYLDWTRDITVARMRAVAERDDGSVTVAEWAGAPREEDWTARKAARRLIWHELLHLPTFEDRPER
jgi:DinB superfamily